LRRETLTKALDIALTITAALFFVAFYLTPLFLIWLAHHMSEHLRLRQCSSCDHWQVDAVKTAKDGYAVAQCHRPQQFKSLNPQYPIQRASDSCSAWTVRKPKPVAPDPWGYG
jgi:hypothetical protein